MKQQPSTLIKLESLDRSYTEIIELKDLINRALRAKAPFRVLLGKSYRNQSFIVEPIKKN